MSEAAGNGAADQRLRLAVLISGRGSNLAAIARACGEAQLAARVCVVISDQRGAAGLALAQGAGLATEVVCPQDYTDRAAFESALQAALERCRAELVVLAGFMRVLSPAFVARYTGRMLNIHPALLPAYKGLHTHRRVLQAGEREHGASVHYVTADVDAGPVIYQGRLEVRGGESEQALTARVQKLEHRIYPRAIALIAAGRLQLSGDQILLDGRPLARPFVELEEDAAGAAA